MVRLATGAIETILLGLVAYNLVVAMFGWRNPRPAPVGSGAQRFRVVIPAHNEERVLAALLADLSAQQYPPDHVSVWVLADRCTDGTVTVATGGGALVADRREGPDGKGAALTWYLERHPLGPDESLVVIDADNHLPADLLSRFSDEIDAGHEALQAYLDVSNPDASAVATASALSYWASNRMVQLSRRNLGWTSDLGGTGMCITAPALAAAGGFGSTIAEDQELGVRLFRAGIPVIWLHDVKVFDEKPRSAGVAVRQRSRWATGRRAVARKHFAALLRSRNLPAWDLAIRLIQPSRMGVALLSAVLSALSAFGAPLLHWAVWAGVAGVQVLSPIPFLSKDRVPGRYLRRYPILVLLPLLKIPGRLLRGRDWFHTPHGDA